MNYLCKLLKEYGIINHHIDTLIIILIIPLLSAALFLPNMNESLNKHNYKYTLIQIEKIEIYLDEYFYDNGLYPSTKQGLQALISKPSVEPVPQKYRPEGYAKKNILKDKWNRKLIYNSPGENGRPCEIISYGADGRIGGTGYDMDIKSGNKNTNKKSDFK